MNYRALRSKATATATATTIRSRSAPAHLPHCPASKRAILQTPPIATSGGRAEVAWRGLTGMDARQALGAMDGP
ncbi:hypothetical protein DZC75_07395 [Pseudomonas parafulva]|uniref:Uncharacterized protein n=1 Tax=Pseudomonas parafulva TaxID=157782 RepID=A0AAI8KAY2_9PSED|nr:hypothetical protein DZC75_07395 [Pseudomonas parafulva]